MFASTSPPLDPTRFVIAIFLLGITALPVLADGHRVVATDNIQWGLLNPARGDASPKAADLWGDRTKNEATGMLVRFEKGFSSPPHIHNITYRGVVIQGLMHNNDPGAETMWLPTGSFWIQSGGQSHVTAANGEENLIYLEIDSGPYLVLPVQQAFDIGERPINIDPTNLVWLDSKASAWLERDKAEVAHLWGEPNLGNGSFLKLAAGFVGSIESQQGLKAVVVTGRASYRWDEQNGAIELTPGSFFSSDAAGKHHLVTNKETLLYVNSR